MTESNDEMLRIARLTDVFGFSPEHIGLRHRAWGLVGEKLDDSDRCVGARPGDLWVRARDGSSNPIDDDAINLPNYRGTIEDSFDPTYRLYYFHPLVKERV